MTEHDDDLRAALNKALRDVAKQSMDVARAAVPTLRVRKAAAYLPFAVEPEPTPEERERWRRQAAEREAELERRYDSHAPRVAAADGALRAVLRLHAPQATRSRYRPYECHGCDMDGHDAENPEWPCRTYRLIAGWSE